MRSIHVAVVGATALATGWAVWRGCGSVLLGCVSTLLYWTIASRYEALLGVVEPLATLPVVVALGFWQGRNTERTESYLRLVLLGAAWGIAVWIRQHAGLLALGWIPLVVEWLRRPGWNYRVLGVLLLVPVTATCMLLVGILYEGHGLLPLRLGLAASAAYATRGGFWLNLYHQFRNDEASSFLALVSVASSLVLAGIALAKQQSLTCPQRLSIVAATGALAGLYLFRMREYYHYSMLIVPAILLSQCAVAEAVRRYLVRAQGVWSLWAIMVFYLLVFHYTGGSETTFYYARWRPPDGSPWRAWHEEPAVSADLEKVRSLLEDADGKLYVIPPHRIEPYLLWQVRGSPKIGYGFDAPEPEAFPWEEVRYVLVIDSRFDAPSHRAPRHAALLEELIAALPQRGFRAVCVLPTMTLYERQGP
ncbi:MAG: hypothetical protein KatS3mg110_0154 [Pirellulaceae bacterium]|nr:MAG: hypothetical protein KatS3mg110_0154 [Pirellulaceae bacterium]